MLKRTPALDALDAQYDREAFRDLTYPQALARFTSLWREAQQLGALGLVDWREDIKPVLAIARAINGLPPKHLTLPVS